MANPQFDYQKLESETPQSWTGDFDRRFSRQPSFRDATVVANSPKKPFLSRTVSTIDISPAAACGGVEKIWTAAEEETAVGGGGKGIIDLVVVGVRVLMNGSRQMKRLLLLISLNVAYCSAELFIGLLSGRVGLVSDAFHLTFGCGLLTFSLFAMAASRKKPDRVYTYGYKRLEVLSAFTNALFLLFLSFSLAVEALHAFMQDESEHKHYLIVSAVANLLVNLIGVWFFRSYARINLVYRKAEDMNYHSVCLHVLADSIRSAGLILASWLLTLGVKNAEVLCLGLVSVIVFILVMPLFKTTGGVLLQMSPPSIPSSALSKCWRQISSLEDVTEVTRARFWELVPGHVVGSLSLQVKDGMDDHPVVGFVHDLYHDLGVQDLTVQVEFT